MRNNLFKNLVKNVHKYSKNFMIYVKTFKIIKILRIVIIINNKKD